MKKNTRFIVKSALIGAFYAVLTLSLGAIAYVPLGIELRISEALTILPLFTFSAVPGLFVGCIISNLVGMAFSGLGVIDVVFGSIASLIAALLTYYLRNVKIKGFPIFSFLPPILVNAVIIGIELCTIMPDQFSFLYAFYSVGLGELVIVAVLGTPLYFFIKRRNFLKD